MDVSDPQHPTVVGAAAGRWSEGIAVVGDRAYLCGLVPSTWRGRFQVFDVTNPAAPQMLVTTVTPGQPHRMAMSGNRAFVADGGGGLQVIDVTNPAPPPVAGEITTSGYAYAVATAGDLAYVAADGDGLQIIDVADPQQPTLLGSVPCSGVNAVDVSDSRICFLDADANQLCVVDGTNPEAPLLTDRVDLPGGLSAVAVTGTTACVAAHMAGLQIIDVTDMDAPVLVGELDLMERAINVVTQAQYAYVMCNYTVWNSGILFIVDLADPATPVQLGSIMLGGGWCGLAVAGPHVYLIDEQMLYVIDITDPYAPSLVGELWGFGEASDLAIAGGFAYVTDAQDGLVVVDVSDPTAPRRIQNSMNATGGFRVAVADNAVCMPNGGGLQLHWLQCAELTTVLEQPLDASGLISYPNPFNPQTTIHYELSASGPVKFQVFDLRGRLVAILVDEVIPSGRHEVTWNGRDASGREAPSGVYLSRFEVNGQVVRGRMTLVR